MIDTVEFKVGLLVGASAVVIGWALGCWATKGLIALGQIMGWLR